MEAQSCADGTFLGTTDDEMEKGWKRVGEARIELAPIVR